MGATGQVPRTAAQRRVLIASVLGSGVVFLDGTVVNVALPAIRAALHGDLADQQWVVEAYLLTLSSLLLIGGSLGDLRGRRRAMAEGVAGFGVCSVACAFAPTTQFLIGARALQGVFGALLVPCSLALITDNFPDDRQRGAAIGTWTAYTGVATVIGPLGGGWLIQAASWRWIFAINVVPVLVTLWMLPRIPESRREPGRIDLLGGALAGLGLAGPVFALIDEPGRGWTSPLILAPLLIGLALLAPLIRHERRTKQPMLPLELFAKRNFWVGNLTTFSLYGGLNIATFFLVLYLQQVGGYSPFHAGLALLPVTLVMFTLSRRFGLLAATVGPRLLMGFGPIVAGAGLLLERRIGADTPYLGTVLPGLLVFALGLSMTIAPLTATVLGAVGRQHAGVASAVNNAVSRVGGLISIAALGAVVASAFQSRLVAQTRGLPSSTRAAIQTARSHPLVTSDAYAPARYRADLHRALVHASVGAFGVGMEIAAVLAVAGGLVSLIGIERTRTASETAAPGTDPQPA